MASNEEIDQAQPVPIRSSHQELMVPGHGLPINYELNENERFRHGAVDMDFDRMTAREVSMLGLIEALTDKPNWSKKVFDEAIVDKWRAEALAMPLISEKTWDWCLSELQDKANDFESTKLTTVLDMGSRCVKTNNLIPIDLRDALKSAVKPLLEIIPRDWHPGSNDQVLNLVHPSLYPAIYGKTRILPYERIQLDDCLAPHDESVILHASALEEAEVPEEANAIDAEAGGAEEDGDSGGDMFHDFDQDAIFGVDVMDEVEGTQAPIATGIPLGTATGTAMMADLDPQETMYTLADYEVQRALLEQQNEKRRMMYMAEAANTDDEVRQALLERLLDPNERPEMGSLSRTADNGFDLADYDAQRALLADQNERRHMKFLAEQAGEDFEGSDSVSDEFRDRDETNEKCWSHTFQWLPCNVSFTNDMDTSVAITSYINNLHPNKHRPLYHTIESLISLSIPAWNHILITGKAGRTPMRIQTKCPETDPTRPPEWGDSLRSDDKENFEANRAQVHKYWELPDNPDNEAFFEDIEEDWEEYLSIGVEWKWKRMRKTIQPEPGVDLSTSYVDWKAGKLIKIDTKGDPKPSKFEYSSVKIQDTFRDAGLQVIVKLASIELTPEKPSYAGGSWHIEGMLNEHIVATAIYYFDVDNITESRIRFRQEAWLDSEIPYEQNDHIPVCQLFGVDSLRDEPMIQELGSIATPDGRFLAFPNTLQHKVEPFSLADLTKPGHRRFLVLWLVDPNYRVLSTANVPPQQHEWWVEKAAEKVSGRVSREIQLMIEEQMRDGTLTLEEAKAYRLKLMAERTTFADAVQRGVRQYDFCEH